MVRVDSYTGEAIPCRNGVEQGCHVNRLAAARWDKFRPGHEGMARYSEIAMGAGLYRA